MAKTSKKDEAVQPIIIKKIKKGGDGHHGGAWKVAYADFVTAMMAFFLLLWLLNVAVDAQLEEISSYFDPSLPQVSDRDSGSGGVMGGKSMSTEGAMVSDVQPLSAPAPTGHAGEAKGQQSDQSGSTSSEDNQDSEMTSRQQLEQELKEQEDQQFQQAKQELEQDVQKNPELADLAKNLMVDVTSEGLRIQLVDQDNKPMFPSGSAEMFDYTKTLLKTVAGVIIKMPNDISIRGHTDSHQYAATAKYTNWELSSDRANSSRRALLDDGVPIARLANVMGKADKEKVNATADPADPRNRRISIVLLREDLQHALDRGALKDKVKDTPMLSRPVSRPTAPVGTFKKTPGSIYFP